MVYTASQRCSIVLTVLSTQAIAISHVDCTCGAARQNVDCFCWNFDSRACLTQANAIDLSCTWHALQEYHGTAASPPASFYTPFAGG